jgi:cytochrome bd ubiquinol oxidase subunit I
MGLAFLIVVLKTVALVRHNERYDEAARFWAKIFAINFLISVVTAFPWNSSSAPIGPSFLAPRAA